MTHAFEYGRNEEHGPRATRARYKDSLSARRVCIDSSLTVGAAPDSLGVQRLAWEGFSSLLDLRAADRSSLAALAEADRARSAGLSYEAHEFPRFDCVADDIDLVLDLIDRQQRPLYLHCEDGQAALMIGLIAEGRMQSAGHLFARMAAWGLPLLDARLQDAARAWFAARGLESHPPATIVAYD